MRLVPNLTAVCQHDSKTTSRYQVYKTDGDFSDLNGPHNRYIYLDGQLRLIASLWETKFLRFEQTPSSPQS